MTVWLGVAAFVLVVLEIVAAVVTGFAVRRLWGRVEPTVRPMLAMFTPPPAQVPPDDDRTP